MPKKCNIDGCSNNVFTHSYCKNHSYIYYNSKPKVKKEKPKYLNDELELAKIKKQKSQCIGKRCEFSGAFDQNIQLTHIIRRSYSEKLKLDPRNIILGSHEFHTMFDDGKGDELLKMFPWRMRAILKRMRDLDPLYFNRYCSHNNIETWMVDVVIEHNPIFPFKVGDKILYLDRSDTEPYKMFFDNNI